MVEAMRKFMEEEDRKISIFDTTLRDGEQTPGTSFSVDEKIRLAEKLDELGVDVIEAGFPVNGEKEKQAVQEIARKVDAKVCGLARVKERDIEEALDAEVDMVHTFVSTSDVQIQKSLNSSREEVIEMTEEAVGLIAESKAECMFSPMDATRTDFEYLLKVLDRAEASGADIVNIPDTVGVINPSAMRKMISEVVSYLEVPVDVHTHDDFGLAAANAVAGAEAGASQVQVSVNGIGERAGNAALEEVVMALESICNFETRVDTEEIYQISKLVERLSDVPIPGNKPVVGGNAFSHESGIHAGGVIEDSSTFEPGIMTPEMVGQERKLVIGKHTGRSSVRKVLEDAGYNPTKEEVNEVTRKVKDLGGKGKTVSDVDVFAIADDVTSNVPKSEKLVNLQDITVTTGTSTRPVASISAEVGGEKKVEACTGVGPVDAATQTITSLVDDFDVDITDFHIDAVTGGSDAVGCVRVTVQGSEGLEANANSSDDDITVASVEAVADAVNCLDRKKQ
ncbi:MAG: 2-isopropylmalate synthase [Candidatus Nanohalobium sp.]